MLRAPIPRVPHGTVVPERAGAILGRHAHLTILRASSGYGKSAVVARWARDGGAVGAVLWIGAADGDVLGHLAEAAGAAEPSVRALARALGAAGPVTVVVDDLDDAPVGIDATLLSLVERVAGLHLVVMSRTRRPIEIRGLVDADAAVITADELTLDADDLQVLFAERGLTVRRAEIDRLLEETHGWPAVIRAALAHARTDSGRLAVDWPAVTEAVTELLRLDDRLIQPLVLLSAARDLDPPVAAAALGVSRAEAAATLAELDGIGLVEAGGPGAVARLVPAVQRYLTWFRDPDDPELRAAHLRLAEQARGRRRPDRAVGHALDAGAWDLAMTIFDDHLLDLLLNHVELLARVFAEVPPGVLARHPVAVGAGQLVDPEQDVPAPAPSADPRLTMIRNLEALSRARFSGRLDDAARIAREVAADLTPVAARSLGSAETAVVRVQIAVSLVLVGDLDGALRESAPVLATADAPALAVHAALGIKALIAALRGHLHEVRTLLERAAVVPVGSSVMWQRTLIWSRCARVVAAVGALDIPAARAELAFLADVPTDEELWAVIAFTRALVETFSDPYRGLTDLRRARVAEARRCPPGSMAADLLRGAELPLLHAAGEGTRAALLLRTEGVVPTLGGLTDGRAARVLLALGLTEEARRKAALWRGAPAALPWSRSVAATVAAVAAHRLGRPPDAARALAAAVAIAEEHGLIFPFVTVPWAELSAIADAAGDTAARTVLDSPPVVAMRDLYPARLEQIDLTDREMVVLQELVRESSQERLAAALFVSTNTIKTQLRSLYRKLGATSREEALTTALQVGLLDG